MLDQLEQAVQRFTFSIRAVGAGASRAAGETMGAGAPRARRASRWFRDGRAPWRRRGAAVARRARSDFADGRFRATARGSCARPSGRPASRRDRESARGAQRRLGFDDANEAGNNDADHADEHDGTGPWRFRGVDAEHHWLLRRRLNETRHREIFEAKRRCLSRADRAECVSDRTRDAAKVNLRVAFVIPESVMPRRFRLFITLAMLRRGGCRRLKSVPDLRIR